MKFGNRHPDGNFHTPMTLVRYDSEGNVIDRKSATRRTLVAVSDSPYPKVSDES